MKMLGGGGGGTAPLHPPWRRAWTPSHGDFIKIRQKMYKMVMLRNGFFVVVGNLWKWYAPERKFRAENGGLSRGTYPICIHMEVPPPPPPPGWLCASTHITSAEPNSLSARGQGPHKGPRSSRVVLMLSHAIWALFLSILIKIGYKKVDPILGGARLLRPPPPPPGSATDMRERTKRASAQNFHFSGTYDYHKKYTLHQLLYIYTHYSSSNMSCRYHLKL